jgi:DNA modification methylase
MQVHIVPIDELSIDPANVRKHGVRDIDAIKASLKRFGQQHPILVDKRGVVRAGNGRLEAMRQLGWSEVEVVYTDLEGAELAAFAIADNRTAELSGWDVGALSASLAALKEEDEDLFAATGFDDVALAQALDGIDPGGSGSMDDGDGVPDAPREIIEDEAPEAPKRAVSKTGDLWLLGDHRVICGDSTNAEDVGRLVGRGQVDAVVTDPPYGIGLDTDYSKMPGTTTVYAPIAGDAQGVNLESAMELVLSPVWYIWGGDHLAHRIPKWNEGSTVVWAKAHSEEENRVFGSAFEMCWRFPRGKKEVWFIRRIQMTGERLGEHPTQKPVECMARPIRNHDAALVYDPFLGSGTTLIAAEQLGRKCYGLELEPRYVDVIVQRWEKLTGKQATLDGSGMTFEEAKSARWEQ